MRPIMSFFSQLPGRWVEYNIQRGFGQFSQGQRHKLLTDKQKKELLEDILSRYQGYVMKLAYSFVRERDRAEDIAQEVFH